ncbi:unnamed protein product [Symbiodinium natans]|uniref:Uncharacterized protein n=1 Tax=Symbiodinium natans TaxID=878477 RepID=A0A812JFI1_9DINO|nr:unnamed protein product [Symbiodinium natans]
MRSFDSGPSREDSGQGPFASSSPSRVRVAEHGDGREAKECFGNQAPPFLGPGFLKHVVAEISVKHCWCIYTDIYRERERERAREPKCISHSSHAEMRTIGCEAAPLELEVTRRRALP